MSVERLVLQFNGDLLSHLPQLQRQVDIVSLIHVNEIVRAIVDDLLVRFIDWYQNV